MKPPSSCHTAVRRLAVIVGLCASVVARAEGASQVSEASLVPVAISAAVPVVLLAGAGAIVVTAVQASAEGTVWVVRNVADGVEGSICFAGQLAGTAAVAAGTVVVVTAVESGRVVSAAGRVVAFIPNQIGRTLSYNQRVSP